jgi:hypothetical protein
MLNQFSPRFGEGEGGNAFPFFYIVRHSDNASSGQFFSKWDEPWDLLVL